MNNGAAVMLPDMAILKMELTLLGCLTIASSFIFGRRVKNILQSKDALDSSCGEHNQGASGQGAAATRATRAPATACGRAATRAA